MQMLEYMDIWDCCLVLLFYLVLGRFGKCFEIRDTWLLETEIRFITQASISSWLLNYDSVEYVKSTIFTWIGLQKAIKIISNGEEITASHDAPMQMPDPRPEVALAANRQTRQSGIDVHQTRSQSTKRSPTGSYAGAGLLLNSVRRAEWSVQIFWIIGYQVHENVILYAGPRIW